MNFVKYFLFVTLWYSLILSENLPYKIERLSLEDGISHNVVYSITQDSENYLWFGTMFGLVRYDGLEYVKFRTDPFDINTLSDDDIVTVHQSSDGKFWVGTFGGGLNSLDLNSNKIERYTPQSADLKDWSGIVWKIAEDPQKNIWIATNNQGVFKINSNDKSIVEYKNSGSNNILPSNSMRDFIITSNYMWIAGYGGLSQYNYEEDKFNVYSDEQIKGLFVKSMVKSSENEILCGTNKGLFVFNISEKKFTLVKYEADNNNYPTNINTILLSSDHKTWLGTDKGILVCDNNFKVLHHIQKGENALYSNNIVAMYEDHSGIIWVGSYLGGISKILKYDDRFSLIKNEKGSELSLPEGKVRDFSSNKDKIIWTLTPKGLARLNSNLEVDKILYPNDISKNPQDDLRFSALEIDKFNNMYIGTNHGLFVLDSKFKLIDQFNFKKDGLSSRVITKLKLDNDNNLWIGTVWGLSKLDLRTDKITTWNPNSNSNRLLGQNVLSVYQDRFGIIWVGTYSGLNRLNPQTGEVMYKGPAFNDNSTISNKYLFDFYEVDSSNVWIATGNGINIFNRKTEQFKYLSSKDGLINGVIEGIIKLDSSIYISTNQGISIYDIRQKTFTNYNTKDGLENSIFSSAAKVISDNKILFGGINGITIINPTNLNRNENVPSNRIASVKLFDQNILKSNWLNNLELEYNENTLTFNFSALEFTNPRKNRFAYKLEGIDKDWIITDKNSVTYHLLPNDQYTFQLKTSNSDGLWNVKPASVSFTILPPFWRTYWFYTLVALAIIALALFAHYKRLQNKFRVFLKIEEAKQQENELVRKRAAEDFHDELGHHLTRISLLIEVLKRKFLGKDSEKEEQINRLGILSSELSNKMRDFIWSLDSKNDTLYDLIIRLKDFGDELFYDTSISFTLNGISDDLKNVKLTLDWRRHLTLIFKEAMNNIVKYSNCKNVEFNINRTNQNINIELSDDGKGFDINKITGGNGLHNMKSRAEYLRAKLAIITQIDSGTKIKLEGVIT